MKKILTFILMLSFSLAAFAQENGLNYKEMYEELLEKNNILKVQNEELQLKITNIENILKG